VSDYEETERGRGWVSYRYLGEAGSVMGALPRAARGAKLQDVPLSTAPAGRVLFVRTLSSRRWSVETQLYAVVWRWLVQSLGCPLPSCLLRVWVEPSEVHDEPYWTCAFVVVFREDPGWDAALIKAQLLAVGRDRGWSKVFVLSGLGCPGGSLCALETELVGLEDMCEQQRAESFGDAIDFILESAANVFGDLVCAV